MLHKANHSKQQQVAKKEFNQVLSEIGVLRTYFDAIAGNIPMNIPILEAQHFLLESLLFCYLQWEAKDILEVSFDFIGEKMFANDNDTRCLIKG